MAAAMRLSPEGLAFIKRFESFVAYPYDDKLPAVKGRYREWTGGKLRGTATIGYGHTNAAKHPLKVVPGIRISEAEAAKILDVDLDECEQAVNRLVRVPMTQGQFDALVSFTFNCGEANLKKLIAPMNRRDYAGTYAKFDLYVLSGGERMRGLVRRRDGEQGLWNSSAKPLPGPEEIDNVPEQVDAPKEPAGAKTGAVVGGSVVAGALVVKDGADLVNSVAEPVRSAADTITGIASGSPTALLVIVGGLLVAGVGVYLWRKRKAN